MWTSKRLIKQQAIVSSNEVERFVVQDIRSFALKLDRGFPWRA